MVRIDESKCLGCGACEAVCDAFDVSSGKSKLKREISDEEAKEAASICPADAIII